MISIKKVILPEQRCLLDVYIEYLDLKMISNNLYHKHNLVSYFAAFSL